MTKEEFIGVLEEKGWNKEEYIILAGGSLLLRGIRKETSDLDLAFSDELARKVNLSRYSKTSQGTYKLDKNIEAVGNMEYFDYDMVDGFKCQSLNQILSYKRKRLLPKDIQDMWAIQNYLGK